MLLNEWMQKSDPLVEGSNFDKVLRGMTQTLGRAPLPSYNYLVNIPTGFLGARVTW